MATYKIDPATTYTLTAKGQAQAAVAQAAVAAASDPVAVYHNQRKLAVLAATCGTNGATGAQLVAALAAAGDPANVRYCYSKGLIAPVASKPQASKPQAK
jgi:hypothetical protein